MKIAKNKSKKLIKTAPTPISNVKYKAPLKTIEVKKLGIKTQTKNCVTPSLLYLSKHPKYVKAIMIGMTTERSISHPNVKNKTQVPKAPIKKCNKP